MKFEIKLLCKCGDDIDADSAYVSVPITGGRPSFICKNCAYKASECRVVMHAELAHRGRPMSSEYPRQLGYLTVNREKVVELLVEFSMWAEQQENTLTAHAGMLLSATKTMLAATDLNNEPHGVIAYLTSVLNYMLMEHSDKAASKLNASPGSVVVEHSELTKLIKRLNDYVDSLEAPKG